MRKVLISGMAGFIGMHTAIRFSKDWEVFGFDNFNPYYDPKLKTKRAEHLEEKYGIKTIRADLTNPEDMYELVGTIKPDLVIHLAAIAGVRYSMDNLSLIQISEPTRRTPIAYEVFC